MKRAALLVLLVAVACGVTTPAGAPLSVDRLKFRVFDAVGPPAYCDPDFYPLGRPEQPGADAAYPQIRTNTELYGAITEHEHLPAYPAELDEGEKLVLYRAYKKLRALQLTASGDGYAFDYTVSSTFLHVTGNVNRIGVVTVVAATPGSRPMCPICLAASTLIATPDGPRPVIDVKAGTMVWTVDASGARIAEPVELTGSTPVPPGHLMVDLVLADGRELLASPGHRLADGRQLGTLRDGDAVDGSRVMRWELVPYTGDRTYDLLPAGPTGFYWAGGILLASTLAMQRS